MQLVKSTAAGKHKGLRVCGVMAVLLLGAAVQAQDNSPYSRYGLGDLTPNVNISNRGMGGIAAGYAEALSVNYANPASYAAFKTFLEERSQKAVSGRVLLDVGINMDNRTLRNPNQATKFAAANLYFSHLQLGIPLARNWGMSLGLRPISRIGYKIARYERLTDPNTGLPIDSAYTEFSGNGGAYLPSIGMGYTMGNLSIGASGGYLFGRKEYSTKRAFLNDTIAYYSSNHTTASFFGDVFFNAGLQYKIAVNKTTSLRLGAAGNWKQELGAEKDITRETFTRDADNGDQKLDSAYSETGIGGTVVIPASYTYGFTLERLNEDASGWLIGADLVQNQWSQYRFFGETDSVQNNWQVRIGGQLRPKAGRSYFSNVAYRAGFYTGTDYIKVGQELPQYGITFGLGLPVANYNRLSPGQFTMLNLGFEYIRRGNNDNTLKENLFRISAGFAFSDIWFSKRRYD